MKCILGGGCQEGGQCEAFDECYWENRTLTTEQVAGRVAPHLDIVCCGSPDNCASPTTPCKHRHEHHERRIAEQSSKIDPRNQPANPKQSFGDKKVPLHLFPYSAIAGGCLAFLEGNLKYGRDNFRVAPVEAMTYVRACDSHMKAWAEGRDIDPDSGLDELWKALACVAILIDAKEAGTLIDNRKYPGGYNQMAPKCEAHVKRLNELHADKNPIHYTIADARE